MIFGSKLLQEIIDDPLLIPDELEQLLGTCDVHGQFLVKVVALLLAVRALDLVLRAELSVTLDFNPCQIHATLERTCPLDVATFRSQMLQQCLIGQGSACQVATGRRTTF